MRARRDGGGGGLRGDGQGPSPRALGGVDSCARLLPPPLGSARLQNQLSTDLIRDSKNKAKL